MNDAMTPLRLALVANRVQRNDGQGRVNYELARAALEAGMQVTLLAAYCADDLASHPGARFVRLGQESRPTQMWRNLAFAKATTQWLQAHRGEYDLVQANGFVTWEPCDIVVMHFVHTSWLCSSFYPFKSSLKPYALYQRAFTVLNSRWEKRIVSAARQIIAVSDAVARDVVDLGTPESKVQVIPNGVDVQEFSPGPPDRAGWKLPLEAPVALFVGDIRSPRKNLGTLLQALSFVPGLHLAVAGDPAGSAAPDQAKALGIAERVHFVGKTSKVPSLMRSVDLFVFPSRYEPYGLVVAEAMATGLPVIVSRNVGCASTFADVLEIVEDPDDAEGLAKRIEALLQSPDRRNDLGERARARAMDISWEKTTAAYLSVYRAMAPSSAAGAPFRAR